MALLHEDVYPDYYQTYVSKVSDSDILMALLKNKKSTEDLYRGISAKMENHRYAEGKWSIKEVLQHIMDTERVMAYRALRFARNDKTDLPGFDQDVFAAEYHLDGVNIDQLVEEFLSIRNSTILFLRHITKEQLHHIGTASGWQMSVNALFHVIVGHTEHHNQIIQERYLV